MASIKLRPLQRLQAALGPILASLPEPVLRRLAGKPIVVDGQTLAPDMQLVVKALAKRPMTAANAVALRKQQSIGAVIANGAPIEVYAVRDLEVDGLPARHYHPGGVAPLVMFLHGGGFVFGDLETHDRLCRMLCKHAGVHVLAIEYRLAPEHRFPAGADDAERAWQWVNAHAAELGADPSRLAVAGDSAGGNLATIVAQKFSGTPLAPKAQLLLYPTVDHKSDHPSKTLFADGFFLTRKAMTWFDEQYAQAGGDLEDPRHAPGTAPHLANQPTAIIVTAGFDPLRDEAEAYGEALRRAGSHVIVRRYTGLIHGFASMTGVSRSANEAMLEICGMLRAVLELQWKPTTLASRTSPTTGGGTIEAPAVAST
ncbi:alpha/beta hydrolase [soil metagenome]